MLEMKEASVDNQNSVDTKIMVVGVGGGGGNAVNRMIADGEKGADYLAINTDKQVLFSSKATKLLIGDKITGGKGAGGNSEIGRQAAEENIEEIRNALSGYDMIFITAGMGGGTGTGAAPVVARVAAELGILTVGVVTTPFAFEGPMKMRTAMAGIERLSEHVDSLVTVANQKLFSICDARTTVFEAFHMADDILRQGVKGISDLILKPGLVNVDFNDVKTVMANKGFAHMGIGRATGEDKGKKAAEMAVSSPLLDTTIDGAKSILINVSGGLNSTMLEFDSAMTYIQSKVDEDANIILGYLFDDNLKDDLQVTVIATGFDGNRPKSVPRVNAQKNDDVSAPFIFGTDIPEIKVDTDSRSDDEEGGVDIPSFLMQPKK